MNRISIYFVSLIFIVSCGGGSGGGSTSPSSPPTLSNPSINSFSSSAETIYVNESILLSWTSINSSNCSAGGGWSGQKATGGSEAIALSEIKTYSFTLTCSGVSGTQDATASVAVNVIAAPAPAPELSSLAFLAEDNSSLEEDIFLQPGTDNTFTGRISLNTPVKNLIASYEYVGSSIQINASEQESGVTTNDFTEPVNITVENSDGDTKSYIIDVTKFTGLPIIYLQTDSFLPIDSKDDYILGDTWVDGGRGFNDFEESPMKIRGRGNSTWEFPKKPFQMKLDDKGEFLGMPNDKKWLFLAEYADKTMLRNKIAYEMGYISNLDWTPQARFAEVFINGEYNGTYNVTQKVEESDNRVALGDTGYLLELDQLERLDFDDVYFESTATDKFIVNIKEPSLEYDSEEYSYIVNLIGNFESALFGANFTSESNGYRQFIDIDSFVDWFLISEITKNVDSMFFSSIYLNVIPEERIKMGPLWDFDLAFGNVDYADSRYPEGWWVKYNPWYERLFQDPYFVAKVKERFEYFNNNQDLIIDKIDTYSAQLKWAQEENDNKWQTMGVFVWPNPVVFDTYQEEVDSMKSWYSARMSWLESAIDGL
ncbi:CotH kinase family protein [Gammaproteobacteria bacterium]|nr:CotH kinase family protein [Gammaproteobacteria bacterium]